MDTYFETAAAAATFAINQATIKGYDVSPDDIHSQIVCGGTYNRLRPSVGETHRFTLELLTPSGRVSKKCLHIQIYGTPSAYELNSYIS